MSDKSNYVGLYNQGATCYLNSLMQTLFMTPEFRNAIYDWKPPSASKNDQCLLQQMQKLFLKLQISEDGAVDTKQFTKSLSSSWAFRPGEQRDAHELLRYIFENLEEIWQESSRKRSSASIELKKDCKQQEAEESPMQKFYRGEQEDYVKCEKCGKEEVRKGWFLDIPLAVKNFDSPASFTKIEESLNAYFQPQKMEGEFCEHCGEGGGLNTGFRITKYPRILTLQLKRFEMDWQSMQLRKINDQIVFSEYLNLNEYIWPEYDKYMGVEPMDCSNNEEACNSSTVHGNISDDENMLYELFAVIAHGGSSSSGHYFAYIKDMDADRWLCFNDSSVHAATLEEVFNNTFGVADYRQYSIFSPSYWRNNYNSTSAYVLMYRKASDYMNRGRFMPTSAFPTYLNAIINQIKEELPLNKSRKSKNCRQNHDQNIDISTSLRTNVLSGNDKQGENAMEGKMKQQILKRIKEGQWQLDKDKSNIYQCCNYNNYNYKKLFRDGGVFSSVSVHITLMLKEGRYLLTDWLKFLHEYMHEEQHQKMFYLLRVMMCCLTKLAEIVPKDDVKEVATEICRNCKFYSSPNIIIMHMKNMNLTDDMIKQSELIQRIIFVLLCRLCTIFDLNDMQLPSGASLSTLQTGPWEFFLQMHQSELKFKPIDEIMKEINGNGDNYQRVDKFCYYLRNLQAEKDSVAYWLPDYYAEVLVRKNGKTNRRFWCC